MMLPLQLGITCAASWATRFNPIISYEPVLVFYFAIYCYLIFAFESFKMNILSSFYYQVVQGETLVNEFVLEGTLAHERVHQAGTHATAEGEMETTRLYLYSEALHLSGFADVVEERSGVLVPVEYKRGQQGQWLGDQIQLCAQALCLEERQPGQPPIATGYIYYGAPRRRIKVLLPPL